MRVVEIKSGWLDSATGSALVRQGRTWVLCTAMAEERVPAWLRGQGRGWLTATYNMLPASTGQRTERERHGAGGRAREIERLIGRSLRAATSLDELGERTLTIDCDILQADGSTRAACITGGWVALALAVQRLQAERVVGRHALRRQVAAVTVGIVQGQPLLDLAYDEDSRAEVDLNVVMTAGGEFVEVQGTAEGKPTDRAGLDRLLDLAQQGVKDLLALQVHAVRHG
jgi:ribonuclease PH